MLNVHNTLELFLSPKYILCLLKKWHYRGFKGPTYETIYKAIWVSKGSYKWENGLWIEKFQKDDFWDMLPPTRNIIFLTKGSQSNPKAWAEAVYTIMSHALPSPPLPKNSSGGSLNHKRVQPNFQGNPKSITPYYMLFHQQFKFNRIFRVSYWTFTAPSLLTPKSEVRF